MMACGDGVVFVRIKITLLKFSMFVYCAKGAVCSVEITADVVVFFTLGMIMWVTTAWFQHCNAHAWLRFGSRTSEEVKGADVERRLAEVRRRLRTHPPLS